MKNDDEINVIRTYTGWTRDMSILALKQWREAYPSFTVDYILPYLQPTHINCKCTLATPPSGDSATRIGGNLDERKDNS